MRCAARRARSCASWWKAEALLRSPGIALTLTAAALLSAASSEAQIYTRRNANGTIEATNVPDESDYRLTYPGKGKLIHSRGFRMRYSGQYDADIRDAANAFGVATDLVKAVIAVESEFDAFAVSSKGAQGLMQLMPFTARRFGVVNSFDARQNIFGGVQYLRFLLDLFAGDVRLALAGYNAGENAVLRFKGIPPYKETQNYVRKIQNLIQNGYSGPVYYAAAPKLGPPAAPTAASYAPAQLRSRTASQPPVKAASAPVRARTYYKYLDQKGVLHVAHMPPPEGVLYTTIRAFD
jgi:hypothetical protein